MKAIKQFILHLIVMMIIIPLGSLPTGCGTEVGNGRSPRPITPPQNSPDQDKEVAAETGSNPGSSNSPAASAEYSSPEAEQQALSLWSLISHDVLLIGTSCSGTSLAEALAKAQSSASQVITLRPTSLEGAEAVSLNTVNSGTWQEKVGDEVIGEITFSETSAVEKTFDSSSSEISASSSYSCSSESFPYSNSYTNESGFTEASVQVRDQNQSDLSYRVIWYTDTGSSTEDNIKKVEILSSTGISLLIDVTFE